MGLLDLIAAYAIAQGAHTGGHFKQATNQENPMRDVPMGLNAKEFAEKWQVNDEWKAPNGKYKELVMSHEDYLKDNVKKKTDIHGAGFATQDMMRDKMSGKTREDVSKMNALIKLMYLAGVPGMLNEQFKSSGDIKEMQKESGNKYVPHMVGLTALSDILQKKDSKTSLGFRVENGQPGLVINHRW